MKLSKKQVAVIKSYARGVLVSGLTLIASNALGLDPAVAAVLAALAGPAIKALDKSEKDFGLGSQK